MNLEIISKKILIIDNDLVIRYTLKKIFSNYLTEKTKNENRNPKKEQGQEIKIYTSSDGLQGLGYVYVVRPDLIIIDSTLPKYSGRELTEYIRTNATLKSTPVILLNEGKEKLENIPENFIQVSKVDKEFPSNLVRVVSNILDKDTSHLSLEAIPKASNQQRFINFLAKKILSYSNTSDIESQKVLSKNIFVKSAYYLKYLFDQFLTSIYLTFFYVFVGKKDYEETVDQKQKDVERFRVKTFPALAFGLALVFFGIIQFFLLSGVFVALTYVATAPAYAASYTWDGGGTDGTCGGQAGDGNKWSCAANWSSDIVPTAADSVTFDVTNAKNSTIDAGFGGTVSNLTINAGYSGTITAARSFTISSAYAQNTGTFNSSNQSITFSGQTTINGGSFTASSGTTTLNAIDFNASITFNHNNGSIIFNSGGNTLNCGNKVFNNVQISNNNIKTINSNCSFNLGNNPTIPQAVTLNGTLSGTGTLTITNTTLILNSTALLSGFSGINGPNSISNITVAGATANFGSYTSFVLTGTLTLSSGTLTLPSGADLNNNLIISGGTFNAPSGTMTLATSLTISGSPTFNANGGTFVFDSTGGGVLSCNNVTFNLVNFNHATNAKTVNSNCTLPLGNNPTVERMDLSGTLTGTGTLTGAAGTLALNNSAALTGFTGLAVNAFTVQNNAVADFSTYTTFTPGSLVTLSSGTLTLPSGSILQGLTISGGTFNAPSGNLSIAQGLTISGTPIFNANSGTVNFNGGAATLSCNNVTFNLVSLASQTGTKTINSNCTFPLGNNPNVAAVSVSGALSGTGILTTNSVITMNTGGTLSGFGSWVANGGITIAGATVNLGSYTNVDVNGAFIMSLGIFTAPSATMTISRALTISGGTFNANGGTVNFDGASTTDILSCNNVTFSTVIISHSGGSKTVNSNCNLPLGNNPITNTSVILNGTLSGTGTLNLVNTGGSTLTLNSGAALSGFSGISSANSAAITVAGATIDLSTYTTFTTAGAVTLTSGSVTLPTGSDLNGALIISGGTFTAPSGNMTLAGALTISGSPTFNANGGSITADGASTRTWSCNNVTFNNVVISAGNFMTISSNCNLPLGNNPTTASQINLNGTLSGTGTLTQGNLLAGTLTLNSGSALSGFTGLIVAGSMSSATTLNLGSYTTVDLNNALTITAGTFTAPSGLMTLASSLTISGTPVFNHNNGTIAFDSNSSGTLSCNNVSFNLVRFDAGIKTISNNCSLPVGNNPTINSTITSSGAITGTGIITDTQTIGLSSGGTFTGFSGLNAASINLVGATVDFSSYTSFISSLITVTSGTISLPSGADIAGLTMNGGVVNAPSGILYSGGGGFVHNSGTFNHNNGTVVLTNTNGGSIYGSTIFNNLKIDSIPTATRNWVFQSGTTQTILGTLTIKGRDSNLFNLRSSASGSQYSINAANVDIAYLDVKDFNNTGSNIIQAAGKNITNSGNNTRWNFDNPSISTIGPIYLTNGSNIANNKPAYTFNITDPQASDTVKYHIQIDNNSNFSSPEIDYTSVLQTQGAATFTVGQAAGSGTYTTGSENQSLSDAIYYVRIKGIDSTSGDAGYSTINGTSSAFTVDITKPTGSTLFAYKTDSTSREIYLIMSATDNLSGVDKMMISENSNFANATFEEYKTSKVYTVSDGYGQKTIYVKFRDRAGNESISYIITPEYTQVIVTPSTTPVVTQVPVSYGVPIGGNLTDGLSVLALRVIGKTNNPLANVSINIPQLGINTTTDENGLIVLQNVPLGSYDILGLFDNKEFNQNLDVVGDQSVITIKLEDSPNTFTIILSILVVILLLTTLLAFIYIYKNKKIRK